MSFWRPLEQLLQFTILFRDRRWALSSGRARTSRQGASQRAGHGGRDLGSSRSRRFSRLLFALVEASLMLELNVVICPGNDDLVEEVGGCWMPGQPPKDMWHL